MSRFKNVGGCSSHQKRRYSDESFQEISPRHMSASITSYGVRNTVIGSSRAKLAEVFVRSSESCVLGVRSGYLRAMFRRITFTLWWSFLRSIRFLKLSVS